MPSKKRKNKKKDGRQKPSAAMTVTEVPSSARLPTNFDADDFLFSKLFKSVNEEGNRTINEVVRALFLHKFPDKASTHTVGEILNEETHSTDTEKIHNRWRNIMEKNPSNAEFDINCGNYLLQKIFYADDFKKLSKACHFLKEFRNSLSHKYPLICDFETDTEERNLLGENLEFTAIGDEIKQLEEKKKVLQAAAEIKEIQDSIHEKKKERIVITEIEKLRVILNNILENLSSVLKSDFTDCKSKVNKNLTDISRAKVEHYDQATYDRDIAFFKDDPMHKLITESREELKAQYRCLKIANPCPWINLAQDEKICIRSFRIDKIFTPLKIEGSREEVSTEDLLIMSKSKQKGRPPPLVLYGLAGSGKTSLCLYYLYHWTEGTNEIKTLKDYNLVIYVELRTVKSNSIVKYLQEHRMKKSTGCINEEDLLQQLNDLKLLFIIDGYDEAKEGYKDIVRDIFLKFPNMGVFVTTRTELREEVIKKARNPCRCLEICGFNESGIENFSEKIFDEIMPYMDRKNNPSDFLSYVHGRGQVLEKHLKLPLTLALMIYLWIDCPEILNEVTTCTSLYYQLYKLCQKKIKKRLYPCVSDRDLEKLLILVGKKAWQLVLTQEESLSHEDEKEIDEECKKRKVPKNELLSAFLMYEVDDNSDENKYDYSFMHRTQMEYLSAYFWAEEAEEKNLNNIIGEVSSRFEFHPIIIFLVGHFTRKEMLDQKLKEVFGLFDKIEVLNDDFVFWWRLLTESQVDGKPNKNLSCEIIAKKLVSKTWKLSRTTAVAGLELLIDTPAQIQDLIIDIESGTDPYDVKDFLKTMKSLSKKLEGRYGKFSRHIDVTLSFWEHYGRTCNEHSNDLLQTLYPWGYLKDFTGSVGKYDEYCTMNFCIYVKNLRVRLNTIDAQKCLSQSLQRISKNLTNLRVILALNSKCDPKSLGRLTYQKFSGKLELTLPHMEDTEKDWIVQVVQQVSEGHGCHRLTLEKSTLSFSTLKDIMEMLQSVVHGEYKIESVNWLTEEQLDELEDLKRKFHAEVTWSS